MTPARSRRTVLLLVEAAVAGLLVGMDTGAWDGLVDPVMIVAVSAIGFVMIVHATRLVRRRLVARIATVSLALTLVSSAPAAAADDDAGEETVEDEQRREPRMPHPGLNRLGPPAVPEVTVAPPTEYIVVRGDNLWRIAEATVKERGGRLGPYWRELIRVNRPRLRSGNPDLIYPGERLILPPVGDPT